MQTVITIGSSESCDIVFSGRFIEPQHAKLEWRGEYWILTDVSTNFGVTINGDRIIEPTILQSNSHVKISTQVLHWKDEIEDILHPKVSEYTHFLWQDFFSYQGTLNKKTFRFFLIPVIVAPMFIFIGGTALAGLLTYWFPALPSYVGSIALGLVWTGGFSTLAYILGAQVVKRVRDTGQDTWKFFIPVYNLYLLLFK